MRILLLLTVLGFGTTMVFAQNETVENRVKDKHRINTVYIGGRLSSGLSNLKGPKTAGLKHKYNISTSLGLVFGYGHKKKYLVLGEILYNVCGGRELTTIKDVEYSDQFVLHYINVPILYRRNIVDFAKGDFCSMFLIGGPYFSQMLFARSKLTIDEAIFVRGKDVKSKLNGTDVGLVGGFGFEFQGEHDGKIFIDFRFTYGLTNILKESTTKLHNSSILGSITYVVPWR